ncbi:hypothetical protein AGMMS50293_23890 [Spirochaetia bacterium]|nr:hypothetical protein AGMMS50293_23890 [Spirochaetia bacterium]
MKVFRLPEHCAAAPECCLSVGDRYDMDLARPRELGMGGILVDGVADVYGLPALLTAIPNLHQK